MSEKKSIQINQLLRFLVIGGISVVLDYLSFLFLLNAMNASLFLVNSIAYITGFAFNFFGHAFFTYQMKPGLYTAVKYTVTAIVNYGLSLGIIFIGILFFPSPEFWKFISICVIAMNGFLMGRFWIFRHHES